MNRTRKIVGTIVLLGITAVLILGCGRDQNQIPPSTDAQPSSVSQKTSVTGAQPSAVPQNPATNPVVISPDDGGGIITFATYSFLQDAYIPILEEFHKQYPLITVQVRELPNTMDPRQIASAADTTLLSYQAPNSGSYFLDLTSLEETDPAFTPDSYWSGILDACQDAEGRIYGLPIFVDLTGIYYQEKAFDAADLPYPGPGWTWEDFQKAVNALARTENGLPVYGFADDSFLDSPDETLLSPLISSLLDQTGGEIDVQLFEGELQWYLNLVKSGSLYSANIYPQQSPVLAPNNTAAWSIAFNETWKISQEMFLKNPPAMWKGRLDQVYWGNLRMEALPDGSLHMSGDSDIIIKNKQGIGWAPFPVSADGQNDHTTPNAVTCAVISSGTQHPRAAWTWLNFLAAHPILPEWSVAVPSQPYAFGASVSWGKPDEHQAGEKPTTKPEKLQETARFAAEHGWYSNPYPQAVMAVNQALIKAVAGNTDLQTALEEASSQVEEAVLPTPDMTPIVVAPPEPTVPPSATIDYFSPLSSDRIENLAEEFHHQNPDITVKVAHGAAGGVAGLADAYDCFAWLPEEGLPVAQLVDLGQYLSIEETDIRNDYAPQELDEYLQDGQLFGLPTAYRPNLIYYNADLLAQLGLNPPAVDWSYDDFMELINAATSKSQAEPIYGFALEYATTDTDLILAGWNVRLIDSTGDVPAFLFDTPETRDSVQWLADQVKSGVIFPVTVSPIGTHQVNYAAGRQFILDGRVAFWISWLDQNQGGSYSLQDAKFSIGVAPIPLPNGTVNWRPYQLALGQYISRNAQNPDACWAWIKFLSDQPDNSFGVPARRSVRESEAWVAQVGIEAAKVYQAAVEQRRMLSQENVYSLGPTRDWWNELLADVVYGADPLPLLAELQGKADAYAACLAASSDYQAGNAQQKAQAESACAAQVSP